MGRVRGMLGDVIRQSDLLLLLLCSVSTLYGMVLILSATHTVYHGSLRYVAVQGLGWMIGLVLYFRMRKNSGEQEAESCGTVDGEEAETEIAEPRYERMNG